MLCLSRKINESVSIGDVTVTVIRLKSGSVRLAIDAPLSTRIYRPECVADTRADRKPTNRRESD